MIIGFIVMFGGAVSVDIDAAPFILPPAWRFTFSYKYKKP
ncbi:MAG: hypothetical protein ACI8P3_000975 [Saprospiraceae bacterium]|jgi:hypothetical protein